ncbi:hypothetical protein RBWH47_02292 [Rhodopirellula baltica WH47]|uniref:Uncharacterized protein n=1 Tax=Rhodopirellula baltica WH47 TaxID=991778 RepID=F2AZ35_RHOBT|nr:hypothetical protein RBWH47_02292 [Rhodopirellula baltica WH47]
MLGFGDCGRAESFSSIVPSCRIPKLSRDPSIRTITLSAFRLEAMQLKHRQTVEDDWSMLVSVGGPPSYRLG